MNLEGLTEKRNRKGSVYYENTSGEIVAKVCTKCSEVKELANFAKDKRRLGGVHANCNSCNSERSRKYREENREKIAERNRKYREENRDKEVERSRKWYEENREKIAKYREENREKIAERMRKWREENCDKVNLVCAKRRARKRALPDTLTESEYAQTLAYFGNACALTGETNDLHREHAIPLAIGHGGTIRENMYPMAGRLNLSKGDRNIFEWFEANRKRFKLSQERFDRLIEWLGKANDMTVEEYRDYVYWCHDNPAEIDEDVAI